MFYLDVILFVYSEFAVLVVEDVIHDEEEEVGAVDGEFVGTEYLADETCLLCLQIPINMATIWQQMTTIGKK